jgi:ribosomal protein S12 methylthiotransferase accessory factor
MLGWVKNYRRNFKAMKSSADEERASLWRLADPLGGMVLGGLCHAPFADEPQIFVQAMSFAVSKSNLRRPTEGGPSLLTKTSSGSGNSPENSMVPAMAEMLERHAASCIEENRVFLASINELGEYALDTRVLPACSATEMENPMCYALPPQRDKPMRWIEGISLRTGKACALPFAMVGLNVGKLHPEERLQAPISTGLAAHRSLTQALVSGLLETIERDALSLMWLQMIPGRRIAGSGLTPSWKSAIGRLRYYFLDISTDLEIPVVCCIRRSAESDRAHTLVSCAAGFEEEKLIEKTVRDIAAHSIGFRKHRPTPRSFKDFTAIHHGATYMAHRDRASAFTFLLDGERESSEIMLCTDLDAEQRGQELPEEQLAYLQKRLSICGFEAFAVDLTSVEAFSAGMRVVRTIVPGLQPLPYRYDTRYLAHPRLYEAPRKMGHRCHLESEINHWPLPFA